MAGCCLDADGRWLGGGNGELGDCRGEEYAALPLAGEFCTVWELETLGGWLYGTRIKVDSCRLVFGNPKI